ncbi:MAG: Multidrug resistance transporter, Bcr/CflA family [uncultured Paraburkholderia sp.]|nr:MAG: Multidrug resistance transporter, Bcr/CflA family [uncultured Paraburkholderia sp.]CAH2931654.1 MAG: Multidrug resistance transporter, Bcr/CflA family [uncultured Paraburkholderia sp.]
MSCIASLFVCLVSLTGWGGLWSIVAGFFSSSAWWGCCPPIALRISCIAIR